MEGAGPVLSLQRTGADLYSPKRPGNYVGDLISQHFPTEADFWGVGKQEQMGTSNIDLGSVSPVFQPVENNNDYTYSSDNAVTTQDESNTVSGSIGLGLSYTPLDGYASSMSVPLLDIQTLPSLYDGSNFLPAFEYRNNSDHSIHGVHLDESYQHLDENGANNLTLAYSPGFNYNPSQEITSPDLCSPQYNSAGEFVATTAAYKESLQVSEIQSGMSSEPWSPHAGDEEQVQVQKDVSAVVQGPGQSYSIQSETAWDSATGNLSALSTMVFNNTPAPFVGSPFEVSPLSSMHPSPFVGQTPWVDEYSAGFIEVQENIPWQNQMVQQDFSANDPNLSPTASVPSQTHDQVLLSAPQCQDLISVLQVGVKRGSESPPATLQPRLDDLIGNFDSNPNTGNRKRKRTKFTVEGAEKVRSVRDKGACVSCHYRKTPCSIDEICKHCLKAAKNNHSLAREICVRNKLQESYVGVKTIFGSLDSRKGDLDPLLQSLSGDIINVAISVSSTGVKGGRDAYLPLQVRQCDVDPICRWKGLSKVKGIYITHRDSVYAQRYAIVPGSMSAAAVDKFAQQVLPLSGSHSGEITRVLDEFLSFYSGQQSETPLRKFVKSILRMAGLNGLVQYGTLDMRDGSYDLLGRPRTEASYVSPTVHDQIRLLAAGVLKDEEKSVFSQIDTLKKLVGPNRHARIVGGICLMRLLLLYRDRAIRDAIRLSLPRQKHIHKARLEQSTFMYRRLTVAYGILCRETNTPLTTPWVAESDNQKNSGTDRELQVLFRSAQKAYNGFCNNLTEDHDTIFKSLIVPAK